VPTQEALLTAVAGKGIERGLEPTIQDGLVILNYPGPLTEREDNLHKQSIRSLIQRIAPDWKIHILSMGESGFSVEVRQGPGHNPVDQPKVVDLNDKEAIAQLASELEEMARKVRALA
jgi:hypothetical protein